MTNGKRERALIAKGIGNHQYCTVILATDGATTASEADCESMAEEVFGEDYFDNLEPGLYLFEGTPEWVESGAPWDGTNIDLEWKDVKIRPITAVELHLLTMTPPEPPEEKYQEDEQ